MIVRIQGEGQYRLPSAVLDELNELDNRLVQIVAKGDEGEFSSILGRMLSLVRARGEAVKNEELVESDVVLPDPDTTLEDARDLFVGEGLVPG
jgi:hypothetical protein